MKNVALFMAMLVIFFFAGCNGEGDSSVDDEKSAYKTLLKSSVSDGGLVSFKDGSTGEDVNVFIEDREGNPLSGMNVEFWDADGYELFFVTDPEGAYLPAFKVYPHNSAHWITMIFMEDEGVDQMDWVDSDSEEGEAIWNLLSDPDVDIEYLGRMTEEEIMAMSKIMATIVSGVSGNPGPAAFVNSVSQVLDFKDKLEYIFDVELTPAAYNVYRITFGGLMGNISFYHLEPIFDDAIEDSPDYDADGYTEDVDCDDFDYWVNPDAKETCDGYDNNCNGIVDEGCPVEVVELMNDDGSPDYTYAWQGTCIGSSPIGLISDGTAGLSTYLSPPYYPFHVTGVSINFARANSSGYGFYLHVEDADGNDLIPSPMLIPHSEFTGYGWWDMDLSEYGIVADSGTIHVSVYERYLAPLDCSTVERDIWGWTINADSSSSGRSTQIGRSVTRLDRELMIRISGY